MTLEQAYFITQIVVGIGFVVSIVFWRCRCGRTLSCFVIQWPTNGLKNVIGSLKLCPPIMTFGLSIGGSGIIGKTLTMTRNIGNLPHCPYIINQSKWIEGLY